MVILPYLDGFYRSGEKASESSVFICVNCNSRRTVKSGKTIPKCSKCKEHTYWYKVTSI